MVSSRDAIVSSIGTWGSEKDYPIPLRTRNSKRAPAFAAGYTCEWRWWSLCKTRCTMGVAIRPTMATTTSVEKRA
jgi:hypothetical protein